jgi:F0F1-type ATP synthase membrane subunit c/vacuolar-type H+-ATPase subunit K
VNSTFKSLQIVRVVMLISIAAYVLLGEFLIPARSMPGPIFFYALTALAACMVVGCFMVRRFLGAKATAALAEVPTPASALNQWRGVYIVIYAFSETIAVLGFVLRVLGYSLSLIAPFYIVGFFLFLYFAPQRPTPSPGAGVSQAIS